MYKMLEIVLNINILSEYSFISITRPRQCHNFIFLSFRGVSGFIRPVFFNPVPGTPPTPHILYTSESLLRHRQCLHMKVPYETNCLGNYNKIEWVLIIAKCIINHYITNFSLKITSKVEKVGQKHAFIYKLTTNNNLQMAFLFFSSTVLKSNT